ncbi:MAG: HAD hydrolase-like protein [Bacteroidota bacterium]
MHLIIFDIDGTVVDSVKQDDECFTRTFKELYNIDLSNTNWTNFKNVTDSGLTNEIFEKYLSQVPTARELNGLKDHFYRRLKQRAHEISEITGAKKTLHRLMDHNDFFVAFATGGWKKTATLKLRTIDFEYQRFPLISSDDHEKRSEITKLAIKKSLYETRIQQFETIIFVGDGLWDLSTSKELGINFIGVDSQQDNRLLDAGAIYVVRDLKNVGQIMAWAKA